MNTVNKYFEKLLIEGSEEFELIFRSLLKDYDEDKYYLLEETDVFSEPMLCSFFNSNIILDDDGKSVQHVQAVLTGILSLDCAIGTGGYAKEKDVL